MNKPKYRENNVVIDFSGLPIRPNRNWIWGFVANKLGCTVENTECVQLHTVKSYVYIEMKTVDFAKNLVEEHNLKHNHRINEIDYKIPIFLEDGALDIKIFDLPRQMTNNVVREFMERYGDVVSIRTEMYAGNPLAGLCSGIRIVRLKPKQDFKLKSYEVIGGETTQVSYKGQTPTCRHCNEDFHMGKKCAEAKQETRNKNNNNAAKASTNFVLNSSEFPTIAGNQKTDVTTNIMQNSNRQKSNTEENEGSLENSTSTDQHEAENLSKKEAEKYQSFNMDPNGSYGNVVFSKNLQVPSISSHLQVPPLSPKRNAEYTEKKSKNKISKIV